MRKHSVFRPYAETVIFFVKVAAACTATCMILERIYLYIYFKYNITLIMTLTVPMIISITHAAVYYPFGYILHKSYNENFLPHMKVIRPRIVAKQTMNWSLKELVKGELIGLLMNCCFYAFAMCVGGMQHDFKALPNIRNINSIISTLFWYLLVMWWADISFYASHRIFHNYPWVYRTIHKKHHEFQYQVAWSAEVKTLTESIIVSTTDLLPHLLFGGHLIHLLSWVIIGVLYNVEGHSGYSLLFINTGFHDHHHTMNKGNYGIGFYLDHILGTSQKFEDWTDAEIAKEIE